MVEDTHGLEWESRAALETNRTRWERVDVSFPADLFRSWMEVLTRPKEFFRSLDPEVSFARPLIFYLVFSVLGSAASTLSWLAMFGDSYDQLYASAGMEGFPFDAYMWMNFFFSPFTALISLLLHVGMIHVGVRVFVTDGKSIGVTARTLCYVTAPAVVAIVPILGWAVAFFWTATLAIIGIRWTHRTSFGRAFAAVIIPPLVLTVGLTMLFVLFGVFLARAIGGTA